MTSSTAPDSSAPGATAEQAGGGALAGLKVIDLTRVLGGPYGTQILADHGAEVIKVEPPQGDETRDWGPPFRNSLSAYFTGVNRNKRSIALDLSRPEAHAVLFRLLENADVLVDNFKAGTMEAWGLGYEAVLRQRFPKLIHCRITGFGSNGPLGGLPGYDSVVQAWSGVTSVNGAPGGGPVRCGIPVIDLGTGFHVVIGILMALTERARSGLGQAVDVTLFDTGVALLHPYAANWFMSGKTPTRQGNGHANIVPHDLFRTKGRDIVIIAGNDRQFLRLCAELGCADVAQDSRFANNQARLANKAALTEILAARMAEHDGEEIALRLLKAGVPAGAVLELPDVLDHPQTQSRQMVVEKDGYRGTGIPIKLSRTPGAVTRVPPQFAADSREILREAGYDEAMIADLAALGVLVTERRRG